MSTARRSVRAAAALTAGAVVLAGGLTACSAAKQLTAGEKVSDSFEKLSAAKSLRIDLSVDATADQLVAFGKAMDDPIPQKDAELLADLKLSVSLSADKPLKDTEAFTSGTAGKATDPYDFGGVALGYALASKKDGRTYADLRMVDGKMYLQADVRGIAKLAGQDTAKIDAAAGQLPPEAAPVKNVLDGKWVAVDLKKLQELSGGKAGAPKKDIGGAGGDAEPDAVPGVDPAALQGFAAKFKATLSRNLSFEDKGKSGDADLVQVSAPARPLLEGFLNSFKSFADTLPGAAGLPSDLPTDIPDRKLSADLLIKDGKARSVTFDLAQLADKPDPAAHFPLRVGFAPDAAPLAAPAGAVELDLAKLQNAFAQLKGADGVKYSVDGASGPIGMSGTPGTPLTEAQFAELQELGLDRAVAAALNRQGLEFEDLKDLALSKS